MTEPRTGQGIRLRGGRVILPDGVLENGTVTVANGKIEAVSNLTDNNAVDSRDFDLRGTTIFPGFIDIHIHGAVGVDTMTATSDDLHAVSQFLASQGVTSWLPTLVPASDDDYRTSVNAIDQAAKGKGKGARIVGLHYEGPFVNSAQCGALQSTHFKTFAGPNDLNQLPLPEDSAVVRMITVAPEIEGGVELVKELKRQDWVISIGHTRAGIDVLDRAFAAGARHMTHFMNAMPQLHHRQPGPVGWGLSREDVTCDVVADGIHIDPLVLRVLAKVKGARGLSLISDAIAAAGRGDGDYSIWGETITVKGGRTSNVSGNIAGSVISMLDAVRMMRSLGFSDVEIAQMASTNPAQLLRLDHDYGSIDVGKRADLVAIDQDGNVQVTIVGGEVVFQR